MPAQIVLVEPEIPQNTGNIARTCSATGIALHLVRPLGFSVSEKAVRRAGLDYWEDLDLHIWDSLEIFLDANRDEEMYFVTTKGKRTYSYPEYPDNCMFLFGKETKGLPEELLEKNIDKCVRIPMLEDKRSLNLSNSVAVVVYEYLRQKGFSGMLTASPRFDI